MNPELSAFFDRVRPAIDATLDELLPAENASPQRIHQAMRYSTLAAPSFSLRGGTREILRGIIAKGMGLR